MYSSENTESNGAVFDYYPAVPGRQAFCFSCSFFYNRAITLNGLVQSPQNQCDGGCTQTTVSQSFYINSIFTNSIGCETCKQTSPHQQIIAYPLANVFIRDCQQTAVTQVASCTLSQYYSAKDRGCVECKNLFPNCAACNTTQCLMCPANYYLHKSVYDYQTQTFKQQCVFDVCPRNTCKNPTSNTCDPISAGLTDKCVLCNVDTGNLVCDQCAPGLLPSNDRLSCNPAISNNKKFPIEYWVQSFAPYDSAVYGTDNYNPNGQCNVIGPIATVDRGTHLQCAFYFIQEAINALQNLQNKNLYEQINATIYLFQGDHYFFQCDGNENQATNPGYPASLQKYCVNPFLDILSRKLWINDMIFITVKPLQCNPANAARYTGMSQYTLWCTPTNVKPRIYVNAGNFYFNITGEMAFENIVFTGINGLLLSGQGVDYSKFPATFCSAAVEPNGYDKPFSLIANTTKLAPQFSSFQCVDSWYTGGLDVNMKDENRRCKMNKNQKFSDDVESSLSCGGEPNDPDFFTLTNGIYTKRRYTLFNLYAFPNHMSNLRLPPSLNLTGCDFRYFLADYESLINIEYNNLKKYTKQYTWQTYPGGVLTSTTNDIVQYYFNGADKGARIKIVNSNFKNSRFCKGMIVHRKPIQIRQPSIITNFTHLFSFSSNSDKQAYIIINKCTFNQMNVFTNITALASYNNGMTPNNTLADPNQLDEANYKVFMHFGIILNLEDFGGSVEVLESQFTKNINYFPEAAIMPRKPSASIGLEQFRRSQYSPEYKMTACDMDTKTDMNFFSVGFRITDDVDSYFDKLERMAVIYISRNKKPMYFKQNRFWRNTGTFGGAITINSPNFRTSGRPYLIVSENTFEQNQGLMGGNAIFMRNTIRIIDQEDVCGGGYIENSVFNQNIGLKAHNGGAISVICEYLDNPFHDDYWSSSSIKSVWAAIDVIQDLVEPLDTVSQGEQTLNVLTFKFLIHNSNFTENKAGYRGTAIYFNQPSKMKITNSLFQYNGPITTMDEYKFSPLTLYFMNRAITFLDPSNDCLDEFSFLETCAPQKGLIIDWPKVQGAIHIHHCQESFCANEDNFEVVIINKCVFDGNDVGAAVEKTFPGDDNALSIYIIGGQNQQITNCEFRNHEGQQDYYAENVAVKIAKFFPRQYYDYAHAPIIRIKVTPPQILGPVLAYKTNMTRNLFTQNTNSQILGTRNTYSGSLVTFETNYAYGFKFAPLLVMSKNTIRENLFLGTETSLIFVKQALFNFTENIVYGNGYLSEAWQKRIRISSIDFDGYIFEISQQYGVVYLECTENLGFGLFHNFRNNSFQFNFAQQGSAVTLRIENQFVQFSRNIYKNLVSLKGAALTVYTSDAARSTIRINQDNFENIFNVDTGAITTISEDQNALSLMISNCTFRSLYALDGSAIFAKQLATLYVNQSIFSDNLSLYYAPNRTGTILSDFKKTKWELQVLIDMKFFNFILNNITRATGQIYLDTAVNTLPVTFNNQVIKNTNISFSEFVDNTFEYLNAQTSSAIYATSSMIRITQQNVQTSGFRHLRHGGQGAVKVDSESTLVGENLIFFNITATDEKGGALSSSGSQVRLFNISFNQNFAKDKGGCMYFSDNSAFTCNYCDFSNNFAKVSSTIYGSNNDLIPIAASVTNSNFFNNSNDESLINLSHSNARLENLTFIDNIGKLVNNGITILKSVVTTSNITVNYIQNKNQLSFNVDTGFFAVSQQGNLTINRGSKFYNCKGSKASVIGIAGGSSLYIDQDTIFSMNSGISTISIQLANQVRIQNTQFVNNSESDIFVERSSVQFTNISFIGTSSQSIYANVGNISVINTTFKDSKNFWVQGKAIYCNCQNLLVDSCVFQNLQGLEGGTMYLTSSSRTSTFIIMNSLFLQNTAMHGGAIKLMDGQRVVFSANKFISNSAIVINPPNFLSRKLIQSGIGAALNLDCNNVVQGLSRNCDVNIVNNNSFINNTAQGDGGAIIFIANLYKDDKTTQFSGNQAKYGSNIASYPREVQIEFLDNGDKIYPFVNNPSLLNKLKSGRILQGSTSTQNLTFPTIVSGQSFQFNVYIIDQTGQLLSGEDKAIAKLETNQQAFVIGNIVVAKGGIFNFSNVVIVIPPGSQANFTLTVTGLETYGNDVPFFQTPISVNVNTRKCAKGEKYTPDGRCVQCDVTNYLFIAPHKPADCISCPNEAICFGLDNIAPKAGYYRESNETAVFYSCPNPSACIQGNKTHLLGSCSPGYTATMCANCVSGYRKSGPYECTKCPNVVVNFIYLLVLAFLTGLVVILLVRAHLMVEEKQQGSVYQVLLKLLIHHLHFMGILMNVEYYWPPQLISFQGAYNYFSGISQEIFSFDCFLQSGDITDETPRVQNLKLIFFATLPLMILLGSTIFWGIVGIIRRQFHELKTQVMASTLVVFFIMHPSIARVYFSQFNCIQVGDSSFLRDDITTECFQGVHIIQSMVIALPAILVWIFGVPVVIGIILYKNKPQIYQIANAAQLSKIDKNKIIELKKKYGYMFTGYKKSMFLWELVIVFIKIIFVMITVFLKAVSSETQVLVGLLILIISMILHVRFRPFTAQRVNNLWLYTFQVTSLTMYAGMFFVSGQHYDYMKTDFIKIFFILLIMIPNLVYFIFWAKIMRIETLKIALGRGKALFKLLSCSFIDVNEFESIHMREGVDEDELDIDDKAAILKGADQTSNIDPKNKSSQKRSDKYKTGETPDDPQNLAGSKRIGDKDFASEGENFYGIKPNNPFPQSSDSESKHSMGASPPNYESEKSNGYATKNPGLLDNQDQFPGARRINSPTNHDFTNTSRRHTMNRFMDTDIDISQHAPNTHRKVHPETMLTQRERPNTSALDSSERDHFVFDSHRKPQKKKSKPSKKGSQSKRSNLNSDSDEDRRGRKSGHRRQQSFISEVNDQSHVNNEDDDHLEIDEIHLSDEDDINNNNADGAPDSHRNGIFSTFNQTFKIKQPSFKQEVTQEVPDDRSQNKKSKRKSKK